MYEEIKSVVCPALENKPVSFTLSGFKHLIWKGRIIRPKHEQQERFLLIPLATRIIKDSTHIVDYRVSIIENSHVHFWAIKGEIEGKQIRVIIRKKNDGPLHFFSVMKD